MRKNRDAYLIRKIRSIRKIRVRKEKNFSNSLILDKYIIRPIRLIRSIRVRSKNISAISFISCVPSVASQTSWSAAGLKICGTQEMWTRNPATHVPAAQSNFNLPIGNDSGILSQ